MMHISICRDPKRTPPSHFPLAFFCRLASLQLACHLHWTWVSSQLLFTINSTCFSKAPLGLNFSVLCWQWSQFLWQEIRSYLFHHLLLYTGKITDPSSSWSDTPPSEAADSNARSQCGSNAIQTGRELCSRSLSGTEPCVEPPFYE